MNRIFTFYIIINIFLFSFVSWMPVSNEIDNLPTQKSTTKVIIYPNPARDFTVLTSNTLKIENVQLYNIVGKRTLNVSSINNKKTQLNLGQQIQGRYLVKIYFTDGSEEVQSLIIL